MISDFDIIKSLDLLASEHNVSLSLANKIFYISLVRLCEKDNSTFVELSLTEFATAFNLSKTTVFESLKKLELCNAIIREESKRNFRRLENGQYSKNTGFKTYLVERS